MYFLNRRENNDLFRQYMFLLSLAYEKCEITILPGDIEISRSDFARFDNIHVEYNRF